WIRVVRLNNLRRVLQRGFGVAVLAKRARGRLFGELFGAASESFAALLRGPALVPLDLQFLARRSCLPPTIGDDGDAAEQSGQVAAPFDDKGMAHTGHRFDFVYVRGNDPAGEHGALLKHSPKHADR